MADTKEYLQRLKAMTEGKDPVALQRAAVGTLSELVNGVSDAKLRSRPAPGKWSVGEILAHLAEDEIASGWRYRQMVENDGVALAGFDQELWARLGDYQSRDPKESLQLFKLLRASNLQALERLTPDEWERGGVHAERGPTTVRGLALHIAAHDLNHIDQIRAILGAVAA